MPLLSPPDFQGPERNFVNRTLWTGDNLDILRGLNSETFDLIYLDPPFNSNRNYAAPIGSKAAGAAFKDTWHLSDLDVAWLGLVAEERPALAHTIKAAGLTAGKGMQSYLTMMAVRLLELHRLLIPTGSIYLHCDPFASHYLKQLMDAIFGRQHFRNEVIWAYPASPSAARRNFPAKHDTVLRYSKSGDWFFDADAVRIPYAESSVERIQYGAYSSTVMSGSDIKLNGGGRLPADVWADIQQAYRYRGQYTKFPTQKPHPLLERIEKSSCPPNGWVLDPFCGCATACVVAESLGLHWVGIDISPKAADLVNIRLQQSMGSLFHNRLVTSRTDIPRRTDIDAPRNYRQNKHVLFGQQEGECAGCRLDFPFKIFEVDHVIPRARGGTDHLDNLQLLCPHCNRVKGDRPMEHLLAELAR